MNASPLVVSFIMDVLITKFCLKANTNSIGDRIQSDVNNGVLINFARNETVF
jgi:hypothetical protein